MSESEPEDGSLLANFHPRDFEILPIRKHWEPPCWVAIRTVFRPQSEAARAALIFPFKYEFKVDAFARKPMTAQLSSQIWEEIKRIQDESPQWAEYLWKSYTEYIESLSDLSSLFAAPFKMVPRTEFKKVTLDAVLNQDPETMDIYMADDSNAEGREISVLRIHSSLQYFHPKSDYLLFEKKIPWRLQLEDIVPWLRSMAKKLPKKKQPQDLDPWETKLLGEHPDLEQPKQPEDGSWTSMPRITLAFGTTDEIGYVALYHLDRELINIFLRKENVIEIRASRRMRHNNSVSPGWLFYLFTPSSLHAEVLENLMLSGSTIHFGIGPHISGMICVHEDFVNCIGVSKETVKKYCARPDMQLVSYEPIRFKHKTYTYRKPELSMEGVTDVV